MAEQQVDESLLKVDRWSKIAALFVALVTYAAGIVRIGDYTFSAIVAAFTGVGVRMYIPYHASRTASDTPGSNLEELEITGDYHHGAMGAALVAGPLAALAVAMVEPNKTVAYAAGGGFAVLTFLAVRFTLPK